MADIAMASGGEAICHSRLAIRALLRQHLDANKRGLTMRVRAFCVRLVLLDREASRRAGEEYHLAHPTGLDLLLDVVAVQVQHNGPVAGPAQLHGVPLLYADKTHGLWHPPALDFEIEGELGRACRVGEAKEQDCGDGEDAQRTADGAQVPAPRLRGEG